jgi:hypothetical protein
LKKKQPKPKSKAEKYEAILQNLNQAKIDGNTKQIRFWTDMLLFLEKRDKGK